MFEAFGKYALSGNAVDAAIGAIVGSALGLMVASMAGDLIMAAVVFAAIQAFNKFGRTRRQRQPDLPTRRNLLLQSHLTECDRVQRRQLPRLPRMTASSWAREHGYLRDHHE